MNVQQLIEALKSLPPDAEVYFELPPEDGYTQTEERAPEPRIKEDGRVQL